MNAENKGPYLVRFAKFLEKFVNLIGLVTAWLTIIPIVLFTLLQIADRKLSLGISSTFPDLSTALLFIMIMMLFGFTYLRDGHVRVDIFRRNWSARKLAFIEIVGCMMVLLPLAVVLTYFGWDGLMRTSKFQDADVWAMRVASVIGPVFLGLAGTSVVLRNIYFLAGIAPNGAPLSAEDIHDHG